MEVNSLRRVKMELPYWKYNRREDKRKKEIQWMIVIFDIKDWGIV